MLCVHVYALNLVVSKHILHLGGISAQQLDYLLGTKSKQIFKIFNRSQAVVKDSGGHFQGYRMLDHACVATNLVCIN